MGSDNYDQLIKIVEVLGSEELLRFQLTFKSEINEIYKIIGRKKVSLDSFINPKNEMLASKEAVDLLSKLLCFDPVLRISAKEALQHPYFKNKE